MITTLEQRKEYERCGELTYGTAALSEYLSKEDFVNLTHEQLKNKLNDDTQVLDDLDMKYLFENQEKIPEYWKTIPLVYFWGDFVLDNEAIFISCLSWKAETEAWLSLCDCRELADFLDDFDHFDLVAVKN